MSLEFLAEKCVNYVFFIPLLPFLAFLLIIASGLKYRKLAPALSITSMFLAFLVACGVLYARISVHGAPGQEISFPWFKVGNFQLEIGFLVDNLTAMMLTMVTLIGGLIQVYSLGYMEHEKDAGFARFFAYMSLFSASMLGLVMANNFVEIYMFWELVGLCSYFLIGFWYNKKSAADAAKKAFVVTRFGDLGFLMGIIILVTVAGSANFLQVANLLPTINAAHGGIIAIVAVLLFCGAVGKSAQFPLQIWLPDAMEGPTPVSALIHAATMVAAGVFMVSRLYSIFSFAPSALMVVAYIGAITAFLAATIALVQNDIKRVLAYSTISQLGYMMLALGVGGYAAGNFHLLTHAFFKALLFLCAGSVIHALHTNDMREMGGVGKKMPITGITYLIGCLAIAGIPPFSGFFSKDAILSAVYASTQPGAWILQLSAFLVVMLTALYMFRSYIITFCGSPRGNTDYRESKANMTIPLMILAFFAMFIGVLGLPHCNWFEKFIHYGEAAAAGESYIPMIISLVLAALGIIVALGFYLKKPLETDVKVREKFPQLYHFLENKWYMDDFWTLMVKYFMFGLSKITSFIDTYIIDGIVRGIGALIYALGVQLRYEQSGKVQQYAVMILIFLVTVLVGWQIAFKFFPLNVLFGG